MKKLSLHVGRAVDGGTVANAHHRQHSRGADGVRLLDINNDKRLDIATG